jgi:hypothetical protein
LGCWAELVSAAAAAVGFGDGATVGFGDGAAACFVAVSDVLAGRSAVVGAGFAAPEGLVAVFGAADRVVSRLLSRELPVAAGVAVSGTGMAAESGVAADAPTVSAPVARLRSPPQAASSERARRAAFPARRRVGYRTASSCCSEAMEPSFPFGGPLVPKMMAAEESSGDPRHPVPGCRRGIIFQP